MEHRTTRYNELGYANYGRGLWRIIDTSTDQVVGPHYASKAELFADLPRYAAEFIGEAQ